MKEAMTRFILSGTSFFPIILQFILDIIEEAAEKINRFPISLQGRKIFFQNNIDERFGLCYSLTENVTVIVSGTLPERRQVL